MKPEKRYNYEKQIDDMLHGRLSDQDVDLLWDVISQHPELLDYLATASIVESIAVEKKSKGRSNNILKIPVYVYSLAAVLILGIIFSVYVLMLPSNELSFTALDRIEYNTFRSVQPDLELTLLQHAVNLAIEENFDDAFRVLSEFVSNTHNKAEIAEALILSGIIKYNKGNYSDAVIIFDSVEKSTIDIPLVREQVLWYSFNSYLQMGEYENALNVGLATIEIDGAFSRVAEKAVNELKRYLK